VEDEYLIVKTRIWKASTRSTTEQIIETHILSELGVRSLSSLTRRELQLHLDQKASAGLSFSVVAHIRWQLVAIFQMAQGDGAIIVNPTKGLVTPRCKIAIQKSVITIEHILRGQMVLEIRERLIYCLAVREGMRPGEIVGLQIRDLRDGMIYIDRRIYRSKVDTPKSRNSRRPIAPTATTLAILEQYMELLIDLRSEAWLFASETGYTPLSYSNVYRRKIHPALKAIGLGHVNFQILRRSWVTELAEAEGDPSIRAKMAGHSVDVHENEYRQAKPDVLKRAAEKMDKRLQ
jgi:integrase